MTMIERTEDGLNVELTEQGRTLTELMIPRRFDFNRIFKDDRLRSLTFEDIYDDSKRVINSIATRYTDQTCQELQYDNLSAEGMRKLAELCHKGFLEVLPDGKYTTRQNWFRFFKTTVNNHIKGLFTVIVLRSSALVRRLPLVVSRSSLTCRKTPTSSRLEKTGYTSLFAS